MDNPLTRAEHEEFRRTVNAELEKMAAEDVRLSKRVEAVEEDTKKNGALLTSVERLAVSMENMQKEQNRQGERLDALESRDGEMWRKVVAYAATAIVGVLVGYICTRIGLA